MHRRELFQHRQHVERGRIAIGIFAFGQQLRLLPPLAADQIAHQLEQHVGREAERVVLDQRIADRLIAHGKVGGHTQGGKHGVGQNRIVLRKQAEAVPRRVAEATAGEIEDNVTGILLRPVTVETAGGH